MGACARSAQIDTHEVDQLAGAVEEAGRRAAGGAVSKIELNLHHAMPGADGVDCHADLHAEPGRERQDIGQDACAQGTLAGDGGACGQAAAASDGPAREGERETEPSAHARGERCDGQTGAIVTPQGVHKRRQLARGVAEVAVAEDEDGLGCRICDGPDRGA